MFIFDFFSSILFITNPIIGVVSRKSIIDILKKMILIAFESTSDVKGYHEAISEYPLVARTPGERGNKLLNDA